jgi:hypothetical protein
VEKHELAYHFRPKEEFNYWKREFSDVWKVYAEENDIQPIKSYYNENTKFYGESFSLSSILLISVLSLGLLLLLLILRGKGIKRRKSN